MTHLKDAITKAITYIEKDELPPLWDRDSIFNMGGASSESGKPGTGKSGETEGVTNRNKGPRPPPPPIFGSGSMLNGFVSCL